MSSDVVDVEICQRSESGLEEEKIIGYVSSELKRLGEFDVDVRITTENSLEETLKDHVAFISCSLKNRVENGKVRINALSTFRYYVYRLASEEVAMEMMQNDTEELPVASHWILPAQELDGLWENLCYSSSIKENLLNYIQTAMLFSDKNVNPNIISWNKMVLLHGPPGTGKTSLCKALAQKAAIRLNKYYTRGELVEINSHSLFSKWFSESGKLVMKLFNEIKRLLEDPQALICILIDEVESLAHARKASSSGAEPGDAIRVVNALLTQLDQIKRYKNVVILTTSNVTEAIDLAFVDRADIKQFIGNPEPKAIFQIYWSCLKEMMRAKFVEFEDIEYCERDDVFGESKRSFLQLIDQSIGLSGRALRKVPFLAHALFVNDVGTLKFDDMIQAMQLAVDKMIADESEVSKR